MADRADTGARERLADEIIAAQSHVRMRPEQWAAVREMLIGALAAGVGVPPDTDLVSAPAKERQDARELLVAQARAGLKTKRGEHHSRCSTRDDDGCDCYARSLIPAHQALDALADEAAT